MPEIFETELQMYRVIGLREDDVGSGHIWTSDDDYSTLRNISPSGLKCIKSNGIEVDNEKN